MNKSNEMTPFPVNDAAYGIKSEPADDAPQVLPSENNAAINEAVKTIELEPSKKKSENIVSSHSILSSLAYWGIRQSPYLYPKNLEKALDAVFDNLVAWGIFPVDKKAHTSYRRFTDKELLALIERVVKETPEVAIWNVTQVEQDAGITDPEDPKRSVRYGFVSRYDGPPADRDFIDLDALIRNIYNGID